MKLFAFLFLAAVVLVVAADDAATSHIGKPGGRSLPDVPISGPAGVAVKLFLLRVQDFLVASLHFVSTLRDALFSSGSNEVKAS